MAIIKQTNRVIVSHSTAAFLLPIKIHPMRWVWRHPPLLHLVRYASPPTGTRDNCWLPLLYNPATGTRLLVSNCKQSAILFTRASPLSWAYLLNQYTSMYSHKLTQHRSGRHFHCVMIIIFIRNTLTQGNRSFISITDGWMPFLLRLKAVCLRKLAA